MVELIDVIEVDATADYRLRLVFENGERRVFDMSPYLDEKPFFKLMHSPLFRRARVEFGTVVWPGDIDIAPETLYIKSVPDCASPDSEQ